jgi:hypothetical protein
MRGNSGAGPSPCGQSISNGPLICDLIDPPEVYNGLSVPRKG